VLQTNEDRHKIKKCYRVVGETALRWEKYWGAIKKKKQGDIPACHRRLALTYLDNLQQDSF